MCDLDLWTRSSRRVLDFTGSYSDFMRAILYSLILGQKAIDQREPVCNNTIVLFPQSTESPGGVTARDYRFYTTDNSGRRSDQTFELASTSLGKCLARPTLACP
jgi:hypothetical protein